MEGFFRGFPGFAHMGGPMENEEEIEKWCEVLEVSPSDGERQLTQAWRKFVRANHPDRGGDPDTFKEGQAAYEGLSERAKRKSGTVSRREQKPDAIKQRMSIDLEDVCEGGAKRVDVQITVAEERNVCPKCNGKGSEMKVVRHGPVMMQTQVSCSRCRGQGISYVGERKEKNEIDVYIPPGTKDGDKITVSDEGDNLPGLARGDVIFILSVKPHKLYKRIQADLAMTKEIDLMSALRGYDFTIPSIVRGEWLNVKSEAGSIVQPADVICIEGHGLPQKGNRGCRGNLYVRFTVVLPEIDALSPADVTKLKKTLDPARVKYTMPGEDMNETREFKDGSRIRLIGLLNKPDLNGCEGVVIQENFRPGQFAVQLDNGKTVAVREELMEFITKQKTSKKKKSGPKKGQFVEEVFGEKVSDPDNIQHTDMDMDDDEEGGHMGQGGGCRQM